MKKLLVIITASLTSLVVWPQSKPLQQVCGASVYADIGGRLIVNCPPSTAGSSAACQINLSFIKCLEANNDPAIRVNPNDLVVWLSDQDDAAHKPYKFKFKKFKQEKKSDHSECLDPKLGDQEPFPGLENEDYRLNHAAYVNSKARAGTCFYQDVMIKDSLGREGSLDPHVIIGDGTLYFAPELFELNLPEKKPQVKSSSPQTK